MNLECFTQIGQRKPIKSTTHNWSTHMVMVNCTNTNLHTDRPRHTFKIVQLASAKVVERPLGIFKRWYDHFQLISVDYPKIQKKFFHRTIVRNIVLTALG